MTGKKKVSKKAKAKATSRAPFSNRVRVKLEYVLEFAKLDRMPAALSFRIHDLIAVGVTGVISQKEEEELYGGDIRILPASTVVATHLTNSESQRLDNQIAKLKRAAGQDD